MADLRFEDKNEQKKTQSVFASGLISGLNTETPDDILFNLPVNSIVTDVMVLVEDAAGAGDTLDITIGGAVVADEVAISATGLVVGSVTPAYFETGGEVKAVAGAGAALGADCAYRVVVKYLEIELSCGKYTK